MLNSSKHKSAIALSKCRRWCCALKTTKTEGKKQKQEQKRKQYITKLNANAQLNNNWLDSCLLSWHSSKAGQIYSTAMKNVAVAYTPRPYTCLHFGSSWRQASYRNWLPALAAVKWRHEPFVSRMWRATTTLTTINSNSWSSNEQWRRQTDKQERIALNSYCWLLLRFRLAAMLLQAEVVMQARGAEDCKDISKLWKYFICDWEMPAVILRIRQSINM